MHEMKEAPNGSLDPAQAVELSLLVELEAHWENLRTTSSRPPEAPPSTQDLHGKQRAYEGFRAKLAAYNKRYAPAHVPELLLNTPTRLGAWCRAMRDLCVRVEHHPQSHCPTHLLEKAYRWADRVAARISKDRIRRSTPPATIQDAIRDLDTLEQWCGDLAKAAPAA